MDKKFAVGKIWLFFFEMCGRKWKGCLVLLLYVIGISCKALNVPNHGKHHIWSASPLSTIELSTGVDRGWQDMLDTFVDVTIENEAVFYIHYDIVAYSSRETTNEVLERLTNNDSLGFRVLVDGVPYRQSGSVATAQDSLRAIQTVHSSGDLYTSLAIGKHRIALQWKKFGAVIDTWTIDSTVNGGFSGGRTITATAHYQYVWYKQPLSTIVLKTINVWEKVPSMEVEFTTVDTATLRFSYQVPFRATLAGRSMLVPAAGDLELMLEIDDVRYRESASSLVANSLQAPPGILSGAVVLTLGSGLHTVRVVYKIIGNADWTWRSTPAALDGFVNGRMLSVYGDKNTTVATYKERNVGEDQIDSDWSDAGKSVLQFSLHESSSVLLTYSLPISQYSHPHYNYITPEHLKSIAVRIVVDGKPFRHGSSILDDQNSQASGDAKGSIVLELQAGSHSARLQWENVKDHEHKWHSLEEIDSNAPPILFTADTWNQNPSILVEKYSFEGEEEAVIAISGVKIEDVDSLVITKYQVGISISAMYGSISLGQVSTQLNFVSGTGTQDNFVLFSGDLDLVNAALSGLQYQGHLDFAGMDKIQIKVQDTSNFDATGGAQDAKNVSVKVTPVNDPPFIGIPSSQSVQEDNTINITGISVYDADDTRLKLVISVSAGKLTLSQAKNIDFKRGSGHSDPIIVAHGAIHDLNDLLKVITYSPDPNYNYLHHEEALEIGVFEENNGLHYFTEIPLNVQDINDAPEIILPDVTHIVASGYEISGIPSSQLCVEITAATSNSNLKLASTSGLTYDTNYTSNSRIRFNATSADASAAIASIAHIRNLSFSGAELVYFKFQQLASDLPPLEASTIVEFNVKGNRYYKVLSMAPNFGPIEGNTTVLVQGGVFYVNETLYCQFGYSEPVLASYVSNSSLSCKSTASSITSSHLRITNLAHKYSNALIFKYEGKS